MAKTIGKRLVIDASVAGRAGRIEKSHPAGQRCRDFLKAALTICHRLVMTPDIRQEWSKHQLSFARKWRHQMVGRRKVDHVEVKHEHSVLGKLERVEASEKQHEEMRKDWLLIEAAMAADSSVVSLDETARKLFGRAAALVRELNQIVWVNPDRPDEDPIGWLEKGAKLDRDRMLGRKR